MAEVDQESVARFKESAGLAFEHKDAQLRLAHEALWVPPLPRLRRKLNRPHEVALGLLTGGDTLFSPAAARIPDRIESGQRQ